MYTILYTGTPRSWARFVPIRGNTFAVPSEKLGTLGPPASGNCNSGLIAARSRANSLDDS